MKSRFKLVSFLLCLVNLAEIKKLCYPKNNNPTLKLKESTVQPGFGLTHFSFESPLWLPQLKMIHSFPSNAKIPAMFQCIKRQIKKGSESGGQKMLLFPLSFTDLQDNEQSDSKLKVFIRTANLKSELLLTGRSWWPWLWRQRPTEAAFSFKHCLWVCFGVTSLIMSEAVTASVLAVNQTTVLKQASWCVPEHARLCFNRLVRAS